MDELLQKVGTEFSELENDAVVEAEKIAALFEGDVWPYVKAGILTLLTVAGRAALKAEVAAIPAELAGDIGIAAAGVGAAIAGAVEANASAIIEDEAAQATAAVNADPNATDEEKALVAKGFVVLDASVEQDPPPAAA